jgi:energy-coupling factor transporter ATP-binding protein EcfA2
MLDWLPPEIKDHILKNLPLLEAATLLGGLVILFFLYLLYKMLRLSNLRRSFKNPLKKNPFMEHIEVSTKWLGAAIPLSGFRRRYNQHVYSWHRVFNVRGLRTSGTFALELKQVFVELCLAPFHNPQQQAHFGPVYAQELHGNTRSVWKILRFGKRHPDTLVLAIIGAPGSGKTTLLQHIALTFAANKQRQYHLVPLVPILLFLPNHVQQLIADDSPTRNTPPMLHELVYEHFNNTEKYPYLNPPPRWFAQQLKKGKCLVLLDGLSEVADLKQRQTVSTWIEKQIHLYPRCQFIITARPQGYLSAPVEGAHILEVQPFNAAQVQQFVEAWYLANELSAKGGKIDNEVRHRAKQGARELLERLPKMPTLSALAKNPLLLALIAMLHRYHEQLPEQWVELYAEICELLLGSWQQGKNIPEALTAAQKRVALQPLAAEMMFKKIRDIHTDDALSIITEPLQRVGLEGESVTYFLKHMQDSSGLLLEHETGRWRFAHLTFQEYFAAAHFLESKPNQDWNELVNDSWWHETLGLYAAQGDVTPLVQACLSNDSTTALMLAASCLEEPLELDGEVRRQIETRLIEHLESSEPQLRQLAAKVKLNQRLRTLTRLDEQRDIDLSYITCAEYQLFLDESRAQEKYYQPDHWTEYTFPNGTAQEPICGVRAEDAEAFCDWLTERQSGNMRYRLPQPAEAKAYPAATATDKELATWCQLKYEKIYSLTWLTKTDEQRIYGLLKNVSHLPLSSGYALANVYTLDSAINLALTKLRVYQALGLALNLDLESASHLFSEIDLAFAHEIAYTRAPISVHTRFQASAIAVTSVLALGLALNYAHVQNNDFIYAAIQENDFRTVQQHVQAMQAEYNPVYQQLLGALLSDLTACVTATHSQELRQAWRKYTARVAETLWRGYDKLEQHYYARSGLQRLLYRRPNYGQEKKFMLNLHRWLRIVVAREEGQLPAWEGIRIVRERKL